MPVSATPKGNPITDPIGGIAEHAETRVGFDAAVAVAWVDGREAFDELGLDAGGELSAHALRAITIGFGAPAAARVTRQLPDRHPKNTHKKSLVKTHETNDINGREGGIRTHGGY